MNSLRTYQESLGAYIRESEGIKTDTRLDAARKMLQIPVADFIEMMAEVPTDVAAIFSCCLQVQPKYLAVLKGLRGKKLLQKLQEQHDSDHLPLRATQPLPEAQAFFEGMLDSIAGAALFHAVAAILHTHNSDAPQANAVADESESTNIPLPPDSNSLFDAHPTDDEGAPDDQHDK